VTPRKKAAGPDNLPRHIIVLGLQQKGRGVSSERWRCGRNCVLRATVTGIAHGSRFETLSWSDPRASKTEFATGSGIVSQAVGYVERPGGAEVAAVHYPQQNLVPVRLARCLAGLAAGVVACADNVRDPDAELGLRIPGQSLNIG
jgi:hypothetical protein